MPTKISSKEVLTYLNYLGYNNVSAQQLKEFIQDLKKLIKYEERRRSETDSTSLTELKDEDPTRDIYSILHSHGTVASNAKVVSKKESVISVQIRKSKSQTHCAEHEKDSHVIEGKKSAEESSKKEEVHDRPLKKSKTDISNPLSDKTEEVQSQAQKQSKTNVSEAHSDKSAKKVNPLKAKASFIRPPIQINQKSDPVALYHQYQAVWKRMKVPGEDNRTDLRWAIREKMLGAPPR